MAPWDLQNQSARWLYQAIASQNAENWAESESVKRAQAKNGK